MIDYVAIPKEWLCKVKSARVDRSVSPACADRLNHRLPIVDNCISKDTSCRHKQPTPLHADPPVTFSSSLPLNKRLSDSGEKPGPRDQVGQSISTLTRWPNSCALSGSVSARDIGRRRNINLSLRKCGGPCCITPTTGAISLLGRRVK